MLDVKTLEDWLWDAACKIRGPVDAPKYKEFILPLIFLKRLSDVFDEEIEKLAKEYGDKKTALELIEEDHSLIWFYIPKNARWEGIFKQSTKLGEYLTNAVRAVARENPELNGVIDIRDFNETAAGQRVISDDRLKALIEVLNMHKIGLKDAEPDILGRAYEYLLRKFAEGSGQSAGEFYTPREVAILMAKLVDPKEGEEIYDPCLGSGGLLIKSSLRFKEKFGEDTKIKPLQFYGQEILPGTYAMAKMNSFIHRMEANIALGDSMTNPALMQSNVGIAMGSGTDVARESSSVVLIGNDLLKFVEVLKISRWCRNIIMTNFTGTLLVDGVGVGLAAFGLLNPMLAAFIHVFSELAFILNSARLFPAVSKNNFGKQQTPI